MTTIYTDSGVAIKVDGKIAAHEDCCCGVTCSGCSNMPQFISVTFSNIANCGGDVGLCCDPCTDLNAEWIIEAIDDCKWRYGAMEVDLLCVDRPSIGVEAYLDGANTKIRIRATTGFFVEPYCFDNGWNLPVGDLWDCTFPVVINNDLLCGGSTWKCVSTGGTATIDRV